MASAGCIQLTPCYYMLYYSVQARRVVSVSIYWFNQLYLTVLVRYVDVLDLFSRECGWRGCTPLLLTSLGVSAAGRETDSPHRFGLYLIAALNQGGRSLGTHRPSRPVKARKLERLESGEGSKARKLASPLPRLPLPRGASFHPHPPTADTHRLLSTPKPRVPPICSVLPFCLTARMYARSVLT